MSGAVRNERHSSLIGSANGLLAAAVAALAMGSVPSAAGAQNDGRSGKEVVEAVCASCHATGTHGAPKIGDKKAWAMRAAQGLSSLTKHALEGIRQMPSHGGNPSLTDLEIGRAVTYMVNQSGGSWVEPASPAALAAERTGEQVVQLQCRKCHEAGAGGAPRIGNRAEWIPRMKQGLDVLVRSAIRGHGGMPARGGMADLTDSEVRAAVVHMFSGGAAPAAQAPAAGAGAPRDSHHKVVGGIEIYLGIVSAETLRAQHAGGDVESAMHRRIPRGRGYHHVNVSLFDADTRVEIKDAQVQARVSNPLTGTTRKLEPMAVNNMVSYGNYFQMIGSDPYTVTVEIRRPGMPQPVEATFEVRH